MGLYGVVGGRQLAGNMGLRCIIFVLIVVIITFIIIVIITLHVAVSTSQVIMLTSFVCVCESLDTKLKVLGNHLKAGGQCMPDSRCPTKTLSAHGEIWPDQPDVPAVFHLMAPG